MSLIPDPTIELQSLGVSKSEAFAIERVVVVGSPFFATGSAWLAGVVANNVPGVHMTAGQVRDVMVAVVILVAATIIKWLHGRQNPALIGRATVGVLVGGVAGGLPPVPADPPLALPSDLPPVPAGFDPAPFDPAPMPAPLVPAQGAVVGQA